MDEKTVVIQNAIDKMNRLGQIKQPFLFIIDFELNHPVIEPIPLKSSDILFDINGLNNEGQPVQLPDCPVFYPMTPDQERYNVAFNKVQKRIHAGDSYLINLTQPCEVSTNLSLRQIFCLAKAPYRLYYRNQFVVFSPETFVKISDGQISSYPMKGTIDASLPDAKEQLLANKKERAEHLTMVDLIRNDLSLFAKNVKVDKLCYLDLIKTSRGALWQMSSKISGKLPKDYSEKIGSILFSMLPAGSISGAPKRKTIDIIKEVEHYQRGYYTGIFGYFDGEKMDSAVMIRFVENIDGKMVYKSGGGITAESELQSEYNELIQKIYVPIN